MLLKELESLTCKARRYRGRLALSSGLMLVQSAAALVIPWLAARVTAVLTTAAESPAPALDSTFALMLILFAVYAVLGAGQSYLLASTGGHLSAELRIGLYDHLQSLPLEHHEGTRRGEALSKLYYDVDVVSGFLTGAIPNAAPILLTSAGALFMMVWIHWPLGCIAGLAIPSAFVVMKLAARRIRPLYHELGDAYGTAYASDEQNLSLLLLVKAFNRESSASSRYRHDALRVMDLSRRVSRVQILVKAIIEFVAVAGLVLLVWLVSREIVEGSLAASDLVAFFMYGMLLTRPAGAAVSMVGALQHALTAQARLDGVLGKDPEPESGALPEPRGVAGAIEFREVRFAYPGCEPVLDGLNVRIAAGKTWSSSARTARENPPWRGY